jgi:hypothetical protein
MVTLIDGNDTKKVGWVSRYIMRISTHFLLNHLNQRQALAIWPRGALKEDPQTERRREKAGLAQR